MIKLYVLLISLLRVHGVFSYSVVYTHIGDNVSLPCIYASSARYLCWYKQAAGEQPQIISSDYIHSLHGNSEKFDGNKRFSVHAEAGSYHLKISNIQQSDSAIYYCGRTSVATTEFDNGTFLVLKESMHISFHQQKVSKPVQPGDSVTLNCTVHTGTSNKEHTVYWFREDSRSSGLGVMYVHTNSSSHCVKSLESGSATKRCMYSLTKRNVSLSDAGIYYCAVASCGEIVFGNGTRLDLEAQPQTSVPDYTADTQNEECDALQYVAVDFKKRQSKRRRHRSTEETTVYSSLRVSELQ
ncbi:tyrosine-protein phosphatase non-receptor type substrate 1-like [Sphaeramia orbicularis]|uniref:Tyrosine-protein phosphatase non-receptor type substrate 1-like n=1 Tax=Sphaeramia orbicularis TaxID=375764 RepID=A0A673CKH6_9TELE|nr:tyrosine-protein phosphatase non-receptor type substrate 1-like [Sphaeramia orbicularis]